MVHKIELILQPQQNILSLLRGVLYANKKRCEFNTVSSVKVGKEG